MKGLYWEEWDAGTEFESPARTVFRWSTLLPFPS